jgi:HAD superfamily hydrolase (TIGR01549 family)
MYQPYCNRQVKTVILLDLWGTLGTSVCKEPVWEAQRLLGYRVNQHSIGEQKMETMEEDKHFLRHCLTTNIADPHQFLQHTAATFDLVVPPDSLRQFRKVLDEESSYTTVFEDVFHTLSALRQRGYRLGVVSNAWAFPFEHIFEKINVNGFTLGSFFEHIVGSYEVGFRKPEPQIFLEAVRRFGVAPEQCLFVGDDIEADIKGAAAVGIQPALIDRPGRYRKRDLSKIPGAVYLSRLNDLITHLDEMPQLLRSAS